jgi:methionyl-tRNA formyltransferase
MRVVFFGTPDFAVPSLRALMDGPDDVVGVVCQPDKPAGRGQRLTAPPVKQAAIAMGIPVLQPAKVRTIEFLDQLRAWKPDLIVVAAYGRILPNSILELPPLGCINVHASLLPKYRGAAPMQWAILNGDQRTGVTIMRVEEKMDAGNMLLVRETPVRSDDTLASLHDRLAELGAAALTEAIELLRRGELEGIPQDEAQATYAPMISKEQGRIDWTQSAVAIERQVRAFHPWPSAYTLLGGKVVKIHRAKAVTGRAFNTPAGTIVAIGDEIGVACGDGVLMIEELQLEGRKRLAAAEFSRGNHVHVGTIFTDETRTREDKP